MREYLAVEVEGLSKTYPGGVEAVRGIDFDVGTGEVFGLIGPNGAGKSTTVGMFTTTVAPTAGRPAGRLRRRDRTVRRPSDQRRRHPGAGGGPGAHRP